MRTEILGLLSKHFPHAEEEKLKSHAENLDHRRSIAAAYHDVMRKQRSIDADEKSLKKAHESLRRAEKHVRELGYHGGKLLENAAQRIDRVDLDFFADVNDLEGVQFGTSQGNIEALANALRVMGDDLAMGLERSNPADDHIQLAKLGAPQKRDAHMFTNALYDVFEELAGRTPTVSTDPHKDGNKAFGPSLDFVRDAFLTTKLDASPENWARRVCKEKKGAFSG